MKNFNHSLAKTGARPSCQPSSVMPPVPRPFDFGFFQRRPLAPMSAAMLMLNTPADEVTGLIEEGRLRWAFDIRCQAACRREVRVLWQSMLVFTRLYPESAVVEQSEAEEFAGIIKMILPPGVVVAAEKTNVAPLRVLPPTEPVLTGIEVAQCFSCRSQHVQHLIREKSLQTLNHRHGPKASPLVTRASVVNFLKHRRMS